MYKLYIDESGNTGETLKKDSIYNFKEQPYYVLAGILTNKDQEEMFQNFIYKKKIEHKIEGGELKAKKLYDSRNRFIKELIEFIKEKKIPFFIELMDKVYYLNIQIVEFIIPTASMKISNDSIYGKRVLASDIGKSLNEDVYTNFIETCKTYTEKALEDFFIFLISHFNSNNKELSNHVKLTKEDYYSMKSKNSDAFKRFLPVPNLNPSQRYIHLLPNYHAFTGLIGRAQKFKEIKMISEFEIIHDEQKQFDVIFKEAISFMKRTNHNRLISGTFANDFTSFNINKNQKLYFEDSKTNIFLQVADVLAGFTMKYWNDFIDNNKEKTDLYLETINKLGNPNLKDSTGINLVVNLHDYNNFHLE